MPFTDAERRAIAVGWSSATCDQSTYAAEHGISTRALRAWVERYGAGDRPQAKARAIVERAIRELQDLLLALDAEAACRNGGGEGEPEGGVPQRHAEPDGAAPEPAEVRRTAMPHAGFFSGF